MWCLLYRHDGDLVTTVRGMPQIRVVLAEDGDLLRAGVLALLDAYDDIDVVATATSLPELISAVDEHRPDVLLTDIRMPPGLHRRGHPRGRRAASHAPGASGWSR